MFRNMKLRYLALFGLGLVCLTSICVSLAVPESEPTPQPVASPSPEDNSSNIMLLEANDCGQDVVGETTDRPGQHINFAQDDRFSNDEARSLVLLAAKPNLQIRLFDSPEAELSDDWVKVFVKQETGVYCLPSLERTYEDEVVQVTYHHVNGLDGKVSLMIVEEGTYAALPGGESTSTLSPPAATASAISLPSATAAPTVPTIEAAGCIPIGTARETGTVTNIIDGDTIDVSIEGEAYRVRYIGIDTPERGDPYFGEATDRNSQLLETRSLILVKDVSETDQFGRILRYVISGDEFVNYELVRQGFALASTYPPDVACSTTFAEAQGQARSEGLGLWGATLALPSPTFPPGSTAKVEIVFILFDGAVPRVESDEYAQITNRGASPINLIGWRLNAGDPGQDFYFPSFSIEPGQSCRVYTDESHPETCGFSYGSASAIWNNGGDCGYLYDDGGALVSEYCY